MNTQNAIFKPGNNLESSSYEAVVGEKNSAYYLAKFKRFDEQADGIKVSWNWGAFLISWVWAIYRKMYAWGIALFFCFFVVSAAFSRNSLRTAGVTLLICVLFAIFADSIYYGHVKRKITDARRMIADERTLLESLRSGGGVHKWAIWVFIYIPLMLAVIAIPVAIIIPLFLKTRGH